jgi:hypothetical protein
MDRRPIKAMWTGASFVPEGRDMRYCQYMFETGQVFAIDPEQDERDMNAHKHYFAQLKEAWKNLPEELDAKYPDETIFRKKLLIETGWCHEEELVCDSPEQAALVVAFSAPLDPSCVIDIHGNVVKKYTARSQKVSQMGPKDFQRSKWDVLNRAAELIRVTPKELEKNTGRSA